MPPHATPHSPPSRDLRPGLLLLVLFAACVAPRKGYEGTAEEFGQLLADTNAQPVGGPTSEGMIDGTDQPPPDPTAADVARMQAEARVAQAAKPELTPEMQLLDLYIRFGERIVPARMPDGTIFVSKPFIMPLGKAQKVVDLIGALEPFPFGLRAKPEPIAEGSSSLQRPPQDPEVVSYEILDKWDIESYGNLSSPNPVSPALVEIGDAFVVTAVPELLATFERFIDLFGQVPQIELEAKIIEIVETDTTDIGIKGIPGIPIFQFGSHNFVSAFDFNLSNEEDPTEALLTLGALQDGTTFNAIIEAVQKWDNVSIETRPKTIVRAGGTARLESTFRVPFLEVKTVNDAGSFSTGLNYLEVGTKLYISPRVVGAQVLALDVQLEGSQTVGTQNTFSPRDGDALSTPILATRSARSLVYRKPGQTLLIGGLTRDRIQNRQSKVPILGDIPLLGMFFRSKFDVREKEHVIFAISPRIVQPGDFDVDF